MAGAMSAAREEWEAARREAAGRFGPYRNTPREDEAFEAYLDETSAIWRVFATADPGEAGRLFAETMAAVSAASTKFPPR